MCACVEVRVRSLANRFWNSSLCSSGTILGSKMSMTRRKKCLQREREREGGREGGERERDRERGGREGGGRGRGERVYP